MKNLKEYSDQKLINILQQLNKDLEKEKAIEEELPIIIAKSYKMCIDKVEDELKFRGSSIK